MKVILISGKAGSGKNEVANLLKKHLGNAVITSFSKYIKLYALEFSNWDGRDITKPRDFLQNMGDVLRSIDPDFLVRRIVEDFKVYETKFSYVIISDVRLIHELEAVKNRSKYPVITIRVNALKSARNLTLEEKMHKTELELDNYSNFDYMILNNFDDGLEYQVESIVKNDIFLEEEK